MTDEELRRLIVVNCYQPSTSKLVATPPIQRVVWIGNNFQRIECEGVWKGWQIDVVLPPAAAIELARRVERAVASQEELKAEQRENHVRLLINKAAKLVVRAEKINASIGDEFGVSQIKREAREVEDEINELGFHIERETPAPEEVEEEAEVEDGGEAEGAEE